jgi:hypothetical protein
MVLFFFSTYAKGSSSLPFDFAQDERQHGTLSCFVGSFSPRRAKRTTKEDKVPLTVTLENRRTEEPENHEQQTTDNGQWGNLCRYCACSAR